MSESQSSDPAAWQWAFGALVTVGGLVAAALGAAIRALHGEIGAVASDVAHGRELAAGLYVTRKELREHERRMRTMMIDLIANRPPVKPDAERKACFDDDDDN